MVSIVLLMVPLADDQSISIDGHMHPFTVSIMMLLRVQIIRIKSFGGWARLVLGSFLTCSCACADQNDGRQGSAGLSGCDPRRQPRRQGSKDRSAEREGRLSGCRAQNQVAPPINRSVLCGSYPFMDAHIHLWMLIMYPFLGGVDAVLLCWRMRGASLSRCLKKGQRSRNATGDDYLSLKIGVFPHSHPRIFQGI